MRKIRGLTPAEAGSLKRETNDKGLNQCKTGVIDRSVPIKGLRNKAGSSTAGAYGLR